MGQFLKMIDGRALLFFLLVQLGQAQSRTHKIVCADSSSKEACGLFNEAVEDDDENLYKASTRDHVLVCPRPHSNYFCCFRMICHVRSVEGRKRRRCSTIRERRLFTIH
jgi:hypothetical protein